MDRLEFLTTFVGAPLPAGSVWTPPDPDPGGTPGLLDVRSFGAQGDGSTDDTAAVQAAIDALPAKGGTLLFPAGCYRLAVDDTSGKSYRVLGLGAGGRTGPGPMPLGGASDLSSSGTHDFVWRIRQDSGQRTLFQNIGFTGRSASDGLVIADGGVLGLVTLDNVSFAECLRGFTGYISSLYRCTFDNNAIGYDAPEHESHEATIVGCRFRENAAAHIRLTDVYNEIIANSYFFGSSTTVKRSIDIAGSRRQGRIQIVGNFFDGAREQHIRSTGAFFLLIKGNILENAGLLPSGAPAIDLHSSGGCGSQQRFSIEGNLFSHKNGNGIRIEGESDDAFLEGIITGNIIGVEDHGLVQPGHGISIERGGGVLIRGNVINGATGPKRDQPFMTHGIATTRGRVANVVGENVVSNVTGRPVSVHSPTAAPPGLP